MAEFTSKTAVVTGGTKGLGLATAELLAQQGCDLILAYRSDKDSAAAAESKIREYNVSCRTIPCDLAEPDGMPRLFDEIGKTSKHVHYYVHNAAATAFLPLKELKPHHIDKTFNLTVKSFIIAMQRLGESVPEEGTSVVTVSGMDTLRAVPYHGLLGAAKASLETLTGYFAHEAAALNIRVNGVNPGFLKTESTEKYLGPAFRLVAGSFAKLGPFKRDPSLKEVAEVILFLLSEKSSWIVGQTLNVDGGQDFALPPVGPKFLTDAAKKLLGK